VAHSIAVVCEARADQQTSCDLADRVFTAEVEWFDEDLLGDCRRWQGFRASDPFLTWTEAKRLAKSHRIKAHGQFDGKPGTDDAVATRRVLMLLRMSEHAPEVVVLLRDDDGRDRRHGMRQARRESSIGVPVVIGVARFMRECWVLAGFQPQNDRETKRLDKLRNELGFDPIRAAERLTANRPHKKLSSKRVLAQLTEDNWDRQAVCWRDTDLAVLEDNGRNTGLPEYLDEIREKIVAEFWPGPASS